MKLPQRHTIIKILSVAAIDSVIYSAYTAIRSALFKQDGGTLAAILFIFTAVFAYSAGAILLGGRLSAAKRASTTKAVKFISFMLNIKDSAGSISAAIAWLIIAVPAVLTFFVYRSFGIYKCLLELVCAVIIYITSLKQSQRTASRIMIKQDVWVCLVLITACLELPHFLGYLMYLRKWFFASLYLFILAFLIVRNQEDINENIFSKKHIEKSILPKNLRRFNLAAVLTVYAVILLAFNFKDLIILLLNLLGELVKIVGRAIVWIFSLLDNFTDVTQNDSVENNMQELLPPEEAAQVSPFLNLLGNTAIYFILLYTAYRVILLLIRIMPTLYRRIAGWIRKLFSISSEKNIAFECMDYSDETEIVRPYEDNRPKIFIRKTGGGRRSLKGIKDPVERVRFMYSGILAAVSELGVERSDSDTAKEIVQKTSEVSRNTASPLSCFTDIYDEVRYGGLIPDKAILEKSQEYYVNIIRSAKEKKQNGHI
jgi:hypothetical protein